MTHLTNAECLLLAVVVVCLTVAWVKRRKTLAFRFGDGQRTIQRQRPDTTAQGGQEADEPVSQDELLGNPIPEEKRWRT